MQETLERPTPEGAEKFKLDDSNEIEDLLDKPEEESREKLPGNAEKIDNTYKKASFFQKAGRFLLKRFYQVGLQKNDLNDIFVSEVGKSENYDLSLDEIKTKSEQKYTELYTKKSTEEIVVVDKKINDQIEVLKNDDSKLVNMKYKGLKALTTDLETWKQKLTEMKMSANISDIDKKNIEETQSNIDALDKQLEDLEVKYIETKKGYIKPSFMDKIFSGFKNIIRKNPAIDQSFKKSEEVANELDEEIRMIGEEQFKDYQWLKELGYSNLKMESKYSEELGKSQAA